MSLITCRPLEDADIEGVRATAYASWADTYGGIFEPAFIAEHLRKNFAPSALAALLPRIAAGEEFFDVALDDGAVVGFCQIGAAGPEMRLYRIYLRPAAIGKGIGAALLGRGETFLLERDWRVYGCYVHARNERGQRFYLRQGFKHIRARDRGEEWYMEKKLGLC